MSRISRVLAFAGITPVPVSESVTAPAAVDMLTVPNTTKRSLMAVAGITEVVSTPVPPARVTTKTRTKARNASDRQWQWPLKSVTVVVPFHLRFISTGYASRVNDGAGLAAAQETSVSAAQSGTVSFANWDSYSGSNMVTINHSGGVSTSYLCLGTLLVSEGDKVHSGQQIAQTGASGNQAAGSYLLFVVKINGTAINPIDFMRAHGLNL